MKIFTTLLYLTLVFNLTTDRYMLAAMNATALIFLGLASRNRRRNSVI